jgi:hypothetical protein
MRIFFCILLLLLCAAPAQSQAIRQKGFYILPQAGVLKGEKKYSGQGIIVGGMEYRGWGFGIGTGIDWYRIRTVPIVADIRRNITVANQPFFVYANAGWNIAVPRDKEYFLKGSGGAYGEAGLGYAVLNKKKKGILLSIGFTSKTVTERFMETTYIWTFPVTSHETERRIDYTFNRFILKLGYKF